MGGQTVKKCWQTKGFGLDEGAQEGNREGGGKKIHLACRPQDEGVNKREEEGTIRPLYCLCLYDKTQVN